MINSSYCTHIPSPTHEYMYFIVIYVLIKELSITTRPLNCCFSITTVFLSYLTLISEVYVSADISPILFDDSSSLQLMIYSRHGLPLLLSNLLSHLHNRDIATLPYLNYCMISSYSENIVFCTLIFPPC